jgi:hypothetical protein
MTGRRAKPLSWGDAYLRAPGCGFFLLVRETKAGRGDNDEAARPRQRQRRRRKEIAMSKDSILKKLAA